MIFILFCLFSAVYSQVSIGPFKVVVKEFGPCKEQTPHFKMWDTKIRIVKRNAPLFIDTNFWNEIALDDKVEATITASKWGDGGWKENFFTQNMGGICTTLRRFVPNFFDNLLKSIGQTECPIRAGNHSVRNLEAKITFNAPAAPYGKFKSDIMFGTKKIKAGCFNLVYELVPKKGHSNY